MKLFHSKFTPPAVAGTYILTASCDNMPCTQQGPKTIDVKIDGLVPVQPCSFCMEVGSTQVHPDTRERCSRVYRGSRLQGVPNESLNQWRNLAIRESGNTQSALPCPPAREILNDRATKHFGGYSPPRRIWFLACGVSGREHRLGPRNGEL